jgi:hypothetical protein
MPANAGAARHLWISDPRASAFAGQHARGAVHPGTSVAGRLVRQRRTCAAVPEVSKAPLQPPSKAASRIWNTRRTCIRGRSVTGVLPRLDCLAARASPRKDRRCPQAADGTGANAGTQTRSGTRTADHARPLNEEAYQTRMRLLALQGIAPLRCQLTTCATVLKRELGVDATGHPWCPRASAGIRRAALTPIGANDRSSSYRSPPEWARLLAAWQHSARGRALLALIRGEARIGKTRLAREPETSSKTLGQTRAPGWHQ